MENFVLNQPFPLTTATGEKMHTIWLNADKNAILVKNNGSIVQEIPLTTTPLGFTVAGADFFFVDPLEEPDVRFVTKIRRDNDIQVSVEYYQRDTTGSGTHAFVIGIDDLRTHFNAHIFDLVTKVVNVKLEGDFLVVEYAS